MIIHVYTVCWNEERMLPYFFRHYDKIADKYYILDNNSTDNSYEIVKSHPNVVVDKVDLEGDSMVKAALKQYNSMWKQSRGIADWVIICDVDEHFYHPDLKEYLKKCTDNGITSIIPTGYEMISDMFPNSNKPLCDIVNYGVREEKMDKPELFNPNEIKEINFIPGRHYAYPEGNVIRPTSNEVLLLHYKYLGLDYLGKRYSELKTGIRKTDFDCGYGYQYFMSEEIRRERFLKLKSEATKVV